MKELTQQIAALYLGQPCTYKFPDRKNTTEGKIGPLITGIIKPGTVVIIPHLRHLNSLTEGEAKILYEIRYGGTWEELFGEEAPEMVSYLQEFWNDESESTQTEKQFSIGHPLVWIKLLEWGFDLFRGIENGWAKERK